MRHKTCCLCLDSYQVPRRFYLIGLVRSLRCTVYLALLARPLDYPCGTLDRRCGAEFHLCFCQRKLGFITTQSIDMSHRQALLIYRLARWPRQLWSPNNERDAFGTSFGVQPGTYQCRCHKSLSSRLQIVSIEEVGIVLTDTAPWKVTANETVFR
ncbi:uncharacterized protein EI90DRAFT_2486981 [Cantharellus anzutake]|uniref:uncharacterized protein n=1 Tax=Cantharellus anzutake TaxID=1750568 RepID=UPI0019044EA8|nr:uncharacterized protein EI90DRAFT_2486981 [Cantharellus anzutake]KAF8321972.1 hypothetical protein EI90DRAFT_2486981 [Cantharellus anzutake]